jgi:hypothetical protein
MPGAGLVERQNDNAPDFGVSLAGQRLLALATCLPFVAEIISVDASTQTAAPNNQPANPPFIRSSHLAASGFSEHRIYWEEYGSLGGEPVIVMHGGPRAGSNSSSATVFQSAANLADPTDLVLGREEPLSRELSQGKPPGAAQICRRSGCGGLSGWRFLY